MEDNEHPGRKQPPKTTPRIDGDQTYLGHTAIHDKVGPVDKAALVAGQEHDGVGLFDGLAESTARKMDLAPMTLGRAVSKVVLQERGASDCDHQTNFPSKAQI